MPSSHLIFPHRNIVYILQRGKVTFEEARTAFESWCADPAFMPTQNWLMDCSNVTEFDTDPLLMMDFQARTLPALINATAPSLVVLYAPHPGPGRDMAMGTLKTWDGLGRLLPRLTETEEESLDILGQPERSFSDFLTRANRLETPQSPGRH